MNKQQYGGKETIMAEQAAVAISAAPAVQDNHVYLYDNVTDANMQGLLRSIRDIDGALLSERIRRRVPATLAVTPIYLHIHSYGGELFAGFGAGALMTTFQSPVISVIEGVCASAATIISLSCSQRLITRNSRMLIHQFKSFFYGTHEEFKDEHALQKQLMNELIGIYVEKTKLKKGELRKMLKHDTWFSAEECIKHGLVDGYYE